MNQDSMPEWLRKQILVAAASSGDPGTLRLAVQLAGVPPCPKCDFRQKFCRCPKENAHG